MRDYRVGLRSGEYLAQLGGRLSCYTDNQHGLSLQRLMMTSLCTAPRTLDTTHHSVDGIESVHGVPVHLQ